MSIQLRYSSTSRVKSVIICILAYIAAGIVALAIGYSLRDSHPVLIVGIADIAATVVVFFFSVTFDNSSLYDPYWSVAPVFIGLYWALQPENLDVNVVRQFLVMTIVAVWAVRLTFNWLRRWRGLGHEDWRYLDFRKGTGRFYWPVSFLGIHLVPTLFVFAGCISLYVAVSAGSRPINIIDYLALVVSLAAILIETIADKQLHAFLTSVKDSKRTLRSGLWSCSRHPNYFGEVLFWWGLFLFALAARPVYWWVVFGPVAITMLFIFISIPMIEKHMKTRRSDYVKETRGISVFVPWFHNR